MNRIVVGAFAVLALGAAPALADHNHSGDDRHASQNQQTAISHDRALEIAAAQGVAHVRESQLRRGVWKVEGHTAEGREIEVEIDAHSGAVVKREVG